MAAGEWAVVEKGLVQRITALNLFLVIRGEHGHAQMCSQMEPVGHDRWALTLPLRPGRYQYRYYAIHERVTTYVSPKDAEKRLVRMSGLDATLIVEEPVRGRTRE